MITSLIDKQPVLTNKVLMILLSVYNKKVEDKIVLIESEKRGCFSAQLMYTFYRSIPDMPNHYEKGNTASEADTLLWFARALKDRL